MCALAHLLELRGLATTVVALVLPQVEKTRPPRALMTPFMLGRPMGEPNDAPFQHRVLREALNLLERTDGPVILEHFPHDNPSWTDRPGWLPAVALPPPGPLSTPQAWEHALEAELALMLPAWAGFKQRFGRTSVGLSGQPPQDWPAFAAAFLAGQRPVGPLHGTPALSLRFLADDLKALYGEAAQAEGGAPAARQLDGWFWRQTVAGQMLIALRACAIASSDKGFNTVGGRFLVPAPFVPV